MFANRTINRTLAIPDFSTPKTMNGYRDLEASGLILSINDGFDRPTIFKGYFGFQCYEISLKKDIVIPPMSSSIQPTGIVMKVPEGCAAIVQTAYKPNNCSVEERYYDSSFGAIELDLKCENYTTEETEVYEGIPIAHLYLKDFK